LNTSRIQFSETRAVLGREMGWKMGVGRWAFGSASGSVELTPRKERLEAARREVGDQRAKITADKW
jgi:hypothetical protein